MMRQLPSLNRIFPLWGLSFLLILGCSVQGSPEGVETEEHDASLQIVWEAPVSDVKAASESRVLKKILLEDLQKRKYTTLNEVDPLVKESAGAVKFEGVSLSALVDESTKNLTAAERSTTDLIILKARSGREVLMPRAFLVKYPKIQLAMKRNGQPIGAEAPRVVLPATTNAKIRKENMLLDPLFVSELASVTLSSYERRYGSFLLKRRTDPSAMRGEKLFLQNCVSCHALPTTTLGQTPATMNVLVSAEKVGKVAAGEHPEVLGGIVTNQEFKAIFDKKALRSLVSYLEAFRFQTTAKN